MSIYTENYGGGMLCICKLAMRRKSNRYLIDFGPELQCGAGLSFPHNGPVVINSGAIIGKCCTIHPQVLIGSNRNKMKSPIIGNYVFIGNGVKIIGPCVIGDWCFIAPGAIITNDVPANSVVGCGLNNIINNNGKHHVELYL